MNLAHILICLWFCFYISKHCSTKLALFADDTAIYSPSPFADIISTNIKDHAHKLNKYFVKWKININKQKTQAKLELPGSAIKIMNSTITWDQKVKYLGLFLDTKMTHKSHIDYVVEKSQKAIRILYPFLNRKSELNLKKQITLIQSSHK